MHRLIQGLWGTRQRRRSQGQDGDCWPSKPIEASGRTLACEGCIGHLTIILVAGCDFPRPRERLGLRPIIRLARLPQSQSVTQLCCPKLSFALLPQTPISDSGQIVQDMSLPIRSLLDPRDEAAHDPAAAAVSPHGETRSRLSADEVAGTGLTTVYEPKDAAAVLE